jgi:hypothetical protein
MVFTITSIKNHDDNTPRCAETKNRKCDSVHLALLEVTIHITNKILHVGCNIKQDNVVKEVYYYQLVSKVGNNKLLLQS